MNVRTRIAPSPTGYPHIGTIYQALFNFAYSRRFKGSFIVRIEDTDQKRYVDGSEDVIFQSLDWFGLMEDESPRHAGRFGPYRQSERLGIYHNFAEELIRKGGAFYSYFPKKDAGVKKIYSSDKRSNTISETNENPPESIKEMIKRADWVIRLKVPNEENLTIHDEIRGDIIFPVSEITEQVLIKSDGFPTYHFAVVVDDHLMEITHILRAEEWLSSTPKHILLYGYFGWKIPPIFHTATLRNPDKSKLSKRHGHTSVQWYQQEGYLPEAILNYLAHLGWTHPDEKEIFSLDEFIELFDLKDIRPVAAVFDFVKLKWMNQQYIQSLTEDELLVRIKNFYPELQLEETTLRKLLPLLKSRMETLKDFRELTQHFFITPMTSPRNKAEEIVASDLKTEFKAIKNWQSDEILSAMKTVLGKHAIRMPILYHLLTGREKGLPLPQSLEILGKEKALMRLDRF